MQGSTRAGGATARQLMLRVGSRRLRTAGQTSRLVELAIWIASVIKHKDAAARLI